MELFVSFTATKKEEIQDSINKVNNLLIPGEIIDKVFKELRGNIWFTDKRIIAMRAQGLTGKKKDFRSFPYSKINAFSIETSGTFDIDGDFKIWLSGVGCFEIKFMKPIDIKEVGQFLSMKMLS